jgi:hypothetical protein
VATGHDSKNSETHFLTCVTTAECRQVDPEWICFEKRCIDESEVPYSENAPDAGTSAMIGLTQIADGGPAPATRSWTSSSYEIPLSVDASEQTAFALDGEWAAVSVRRSDTIHIIRRIEGTWEQAQTLFVEPGVTTAKVMHLTLLGSRLVAGIERGASEVWVFDRVESRFEHAATLEAEPNDTTISTTFGYSVAIAGADIVVGDPMRNETRIFRNVDGVWQDVQRLTGEPYDVFGMSVSADGDRLVIGAPGHIVRPQDRVFLPEAGCLFLYERVQGLFMPRGVIESANPKAGESFGNLVSVAGKTIAVRAKRVEAEVSREPPQRFSFWREVSGQWTWVGDIADAQVRGDVFVERMGFHPSNNANSIALAATWRPHFEASETVSGLMLVDFAIDSTMDVEFVALSNPGLLAAPVWQGENVSGISSLPTAVDGRFPLTLMILKDVNR